MVTGLIVIDTYVSTAHICRRARKLAVANAASIDSLHCHMRRAPASINPSETDGCSTFVFELQKLTGLRV
jgi:hypothetical protein